MSTWLTDEWFDETRALAADLPERPGLSARMQFIVTDGPEGDVHYYWVLEDGHLRQSAVGDVDGADVTLTSSRRDAVAMATGGLDPNVAFMQGRMKVAGSMGIMMRLLPVANTPEYQDLRKRIADITEF
ncbi:MAG TPA: SCP2 sterol-binding domain-containing protein [Acidimicrobiales bacterium]|nr:SCP2 sterol-binding domain-containing protein [Acidimicrobiales bacterium]